MMNDEIEFDQTRMHPVTGTCFDEHGLDMRGRNVEDYRTRGFDEYGKHKVTGDVYDEDGFDMNDWCDRDRHRSEYFDGYDVDDIDPWGINSDGFDESGMHRNGADWDDAGYDSRGYDRDGFNEDGWDDRGRDRDGKDEFGISGDGLDVNFARLKVAHKAGVLPAELSRAMEYAAGPDWWELEGVPQLQPPVSPVTVRADLD
jgi:hypothetical protein